MDSYSNEILLGPVGLILHKIWKVVKHDLNMTKIWDFCHWEILAEKLTFQGLCKLANLHNLHYNIK